jgi:hypothetical protein
MSWSAALVEAPWKSTYPAADEPVFRRAYAAELVKMGSARAARAATSSGKGSLPRRPLSASEQQWADWDAKAGRSGVSFAEWARAWLDAAPGRMP